MDQDQTAALRRKVALYREYLARGLDSETGMIYLFEIARLEKILDEAEAGEKRKSAQPLQRSLA